jgi:hypothetical protein
MATVAAAVTVALLAPAVARAEGPFWYVNGEKIKESVEFAAEGELAFKLPLGESSFQAGPCTVGLEGTLKNGGVAAEATVEGLSLSSTCGTSLLGCYLQSPKPSGLPWSAVAQATDLFIHDVSISTAFMGCSSYGIPKQASLHGTLRGPWSNGTRCLEYEEAGELLLTGFGKPVPTSGELCFSIPGGTLTLK